MHIMIAHTWCEWYLWSVGTLPRVSGRRCAAQWVERLGVRLDESVRLLQFSEERQFGACYCVTAVVAAPVARLLWITRVVALLNESHSRHGWHSLVARAIGLRHQAVQWRQVLATSTNEQSYKNIHSLMFSLHYSNF